MPTSTTNTTTYEQRLMSTRIGPRCLDARRRTPHQERMLHLAMMTDRAPLACGLRAIPISIIARVLGCSVFDACAAGHELDARGVARMTTVRIGGIGIVMVASDHGAQLTIDAEIIERSARAYMDWFASGRQCQEVAA